jgi:hypothetical protein
MKLSAWCVRVFVPRVPQTADHGVLPSPPGFILLLNYWDPVNRQRLRMTPQAHTAYRVDTEPCYKYLLPFFPSRITFPLSPLSLSPLFPLQSIRIVSSLTDAGTLPPPQRCNVPLRVAFGPYRLASCDRSVRYR